MFVTLDPGQRKAVTFTLAPDALSLVDRQTRRAVEPGRFEVMVGASSAVLTKTSFEVVAR